MVVVYALSFKKIFSERFASRIYVLKSQDDSIEHLQIYVHREDLATAQSQGEEANQNRELGRHISAVLPSFFLHTGKEKMLKNFKM